MKKSQIYTKTGDHGETSLVSGTRISKAHSRIDLYGEVDELNSRLGWAISIIKSDSRIASLVPQLERIQSKLFDIGSNLACEANRRADWNLPNLSENSIAEMELDIDQLDNDLPPLKNFILPGGHSAASAIHLSRTACRKVERQMVSFSHETNEPLPALTLTFINRLSDYLFVVARWINKNTGNSETIWQKS